MKLETYTARQVPSGQGSAAFSAPGEQRSPLRVPDTAGMVAGAIDQGASVLADISARMAKARQVDQLTEAQVAAREGFAGIAQQMADPQFLSQTDPADFEKRFEEFSSGLWDKISPTVSDPEVLRQVEKDYAGLRLSNLVNVRQQARSEQIDRGRAGTIQQLERLQNLLLKADQAADTAGFADIMGQAEAVLAGKAAAGYFSQQEVVAELERFSRKTAATLWTRRIIDNPKAAMEALAEPLDTLDEDERLRLFDRAQNTYESVLRTQIQIAEKRERDAERALNKAQEATAGQFWMARANGQDIPQATLDQALRTGRLNVSEYRALTKSDDSVRDDATTILAIEQALDNQDQDKARASVYRAAQEGRIKAATASTYLGRLRSDDTSPLKGHDYTRAKQIVSMVFKQDGLLPDPTLQDRYAAASIELDARVIKGERPLAVMGDIYQREAGAVSGVLPADFTGARDRAGLLAYQQQLARQLQAKQVSPETHSIRYNMVQNAIGELDRAAQIQMFMDALQKHGASR